MSALRQTTHRFHGHFFHCARECVCVSVCVRACGGVDIGDALNTCFDVDVRFLMLTAGVG